MPKKNTVIVLLLVVFLPCLAVFSYQKALDYKKSWHLKMLAQRRQAQWQVFTGQLIFEAGKFKGSTGIVIKDLQSGWEFAYGKNRLFASASLVKIPIMAAAFSAAKQGKISLDQEITLKSSDKLNGSGILKSMPAGTRYRLEDLIGIMIYDSDNTATNIVTNLLGIDYLNSAFREFGLKDTRLTRRVADYRLRRRGFENYTTAQDMAILLERIYRNDLVGYDLSERCLAMLKLTRANDRIPKHLPADVMIAHKTGLERSVCHDAGIVFTPRGNFLICVLTRYNRKASLKEAKEFIARIALLTYNLYQQ